MQFRKMCGEDISILGFGAMRLPILEKDTKKIDVDQAEKMLDYALEKGVNYIDTAYPYHGGESEKFVGNYLKKRGNRKDIFLATKLPAWHIKEEADFDKYFNEQLEKLQTDYFDFYLLHALNDKSWKNIKKLKVLDWCEKKKKEGKIKYIGFSFHDEFKVFKKIVEAWDKWDFCQIMYNYMDTKFQAGEKGIKLAVKNGIDLIVMEPIRGGQLAKEPPAEIKKLWDKFPTKRSYADGALQWIWHHKEINLVLSGMTEMQHVKENIESAENARAGMFSGKEMELFKKIRRTYLKRSPIRCTSCKYCEPCPQGVGISSILGAYMMYHIYDDPDRPKMIYNYFIKEENRADKCIACGECEPKCPQKVPIIKSLKKAHELLA
ncbi:MAG: aldo/keto reductase [Candidatus Cloacimonetes bacterium]|nr:aldo/keto reductase [Candidatus Cloacimonadota bacterium]MCF7815315.1 aldo/keto reductase [Candidatus Cloacimonadota bacterium]MCF7869429.1 aldo/keto reductase [Candidatus Cloacimonadota bacterium]MCF7884824.1 aldo/keto reductase [Candidatus Cloacimonadota bacterium]